MRVRKLRVAAAAALVVAGLGVVRAWRRATPDELRIGALLALREVHHAQEAAMLADRRASRQERARSLDELVAEGHLPARPDARGYRLEVGRSPVFAGFWRGVAEPLEPGLLWCGVGSAEAFWGPRPISLDPTVPRPEGPAMELLARTPGRSGWFGD